MPDKATNQHVAEFSSDLLQEKSCGLRFQIPQLGQYVTGFVIRYDGKPYAYVNQCAHVPVELDWKEGEFFTVNKDYLICATHGAHYEPDSGLCAFGPCKGKSLQSLPVSEQNKLITIYLDSTETLTNKK